MEMLTEDDLERIEEFVNTPRYAREPDQLRPTGTADPEESEGPGDVEE
jgi:hypothetical protein